MTECPPRHRRGLRYLCDMIAQTETSQKVWAEEELQSLPEYGFIHEVVGGEHLLPGFRYPINDLFKEWDWE